MSKTWGTFYLGHFLREVDARVALYVYKELRWELQQYQDMWDVEALEQLTEELRSELPAILTWSWENGLQNH